jgi:hypothetical protein
LRQSETAGVMEPFASLPLLPRDNGGPVFAEPWQAQAFALAVRFLGRDTLLGPSGPELSQSSLKLLPTAANPMMVRDTLSTGLPRLNSWSPRKS